MRIAKIAHADLSEGGRQLGRHFVSSTAVQNRLKMTSISGVHERAMSN